MIWIFQSECISIQHSGVMLKPFYDISLLMSSDWPDHIAKLEPPPTRHKSFQIVLLEDLPGIEVVKTEKYFTFLFTIFYDERGWLNYSARIVHFKHPRFKLRTSWSSLSPVTTTVNCYLCNHGCSRHCSASSRSSFFLTMVLVMKLFALSEISSNSFPNERWKYKISRVVAVAQW